MKVKARQYAQGLLESLEGKNDKEAKKIVNEFVKILSTNNQLSQSKEIISFFNNLWNKKEDLLEAEIITAFKLSPQTLKELTNFIKEKAGNKKVEIKEVIDTKIKGGFIVRLGDKILDSSLKTRVRELNKILQK